MGRVLIIGAGGVGGVVAKKCAMNRDVFDYICLANRSFPDKCAKVRGDIEAAGLGSIDIAPVDADDSNQVAGLIRDAKPELVMNIALPYQDLSIMDACLETGVNYLDTANYEHPDVAMFEYRKQWERHEGFKQRGLMALLGCGFDPGVTNAFTAYLKKHSMDRIDTLDILDCNAGHHGKNFATNFNPEINIREVLQPPRHWENGRWVETPRIIDSGAVHGNFGYPGVGPKDSFLLYHEELESLVKHFPEIKRARFWMTFSHSYLDNLRDLYNSGKTSIEPVESDGKTSVPLKELAKELPTSHDLIQNYTGKTSIGVMVTGLDLSRKPARQAIFQVCDHAACVREVGGHAISYTTAIPAVAGAMMMLSGRWKKHGVYNVEQLNPDYFLNEVKRLGLPWELYHDFKGKLPFE